MEMLKKKILMVYHKELKVTMTLGKSGNCYSELNTEVMKIKNHSTVIC